MSSETMNHDLLIVTAKTPHMVMSNGPTDIIIDPTGKPLPGSNWDDVSKLRKAGPCSNTHNTFIDGATIYIRDGRIDAASKSSHPVPGPGTKSKMFRGDTSAMRGSPDLYKEKRQTMRTSDPTQHNCLPPTGPSNCTGKVLINMAAVDLNAQLRAQIRKLCEIVKNTAECSHGRVCPSGSQLEVIKSGNGTETISLTVTRLDTTVAPPPGGTPKCQQPGEHTHWVATYGDKIIKEEKGVDVFSVEVPGFTSPAITGIIATVAWMVKTIAGPQILTVTSTSCASSKTSVIRCYPNGKLSVDFNPDKLKFKKIFDDINELMQLILDIARTLNGGSSKAKVEPKLLGDGCQLSFECEFKERKNHLVGVAWKASFKLDPLASIDFQWPIPITTCLGPFGRIAQWIAEGLGLTGEFLVGFALTVAAVGDISRTEEAVYSAGFDATLTFSPKCLLEISAGSRKLTIKLQIDFQLKLRISPNDKGQGCIKGLISGQMQIGFTVEYQKTGSPVKKLVDYKPEWAKFPKGDDGLKLKEFIVF